MPRCLSTCSLRVLFRPMRKKSAAAIPATAAAPMAIPAIAPPDNPEECELLEVDDDEEEEVAELVGDVVGVAVTVRV